MATADAFASACTEAGIDAEVVVDVRRMLWMKFGFLAALSGLTAATRQPIGVVRADPDMRAVFEAAIREVWVVGHERGIALADDYVAEQMKFGDGLPPQMKASMLNDLAAGNRLEAPWLSGAVVRMAEAAGVAAPVHATLYATVKPYCGGGTR